MRTIAGIGLAGRAAALVFLASAAFASAAAAEAYGPRDLSGVWWARTAKVRLLPMDGQPPPFTPEGRAQYSKTLAGLKNGEIVDEARRLCLPEGMPRALTSAYPFQIIMTADLAIFAHEANRAYRMVGLTGAHADPKVWDPSYMGDGVGRWDGDTLVIDSTNLKSDRLFLDASGEPASPKLHLVEHIKLIDGGQTLEDRITVDDPVNYLNPWTARLTFQRRNDIQLKTDWVCGEPHRDVSAHRQRGGE